MILSPCFFTIALNQNPQLSSFVVHELKDISWTARILKGVQPELRKINADFGQVYRFSSSTVKYKEPNKVRVESVTDDTKVTYVINGTTQWFHIGSVKLSQKTDLTDKPGRRQTSLDFGILTPAMFDGLFQGHFVRNDRATGLPVFDITYVPAQKDKTRHRVWIDPEKRVISKREWYAQDGHLMATFYYEGAKKFGSIWMNSKLTVKNADNVVAGVTSYEGIKVNSGVSDSNFAIN